jgi:hypothetical protein
MGTRWSRIRALFLRRALDQRLDDEVHSHLEEPTAEYEGVARRQTRPDWRPAAHLEASSR